MEAYVEMVALAFASSRELSSAPSCNVMAIENRDFEAMVYKRLADVLKQQARYDDAIAAYQYIPETWPEDPENPTYQWTIA